jgi:NAD(P)-dependent dehydrogenase (short-subunit alcohol dehydrogenase family)
MNNAMVTVFAPFNERSPEEFRRVTEVTYLGTVYRTMSALKRMLLRDRGCIIQVGSALAYRSIPLQSAYCGAKHAIVGFTDSIRIEMNHAGSRVWITAVSSAGYDYAAVRLVPDAHAATTATGSADLRARGGGPAIVAASRKRRREILVGGPTVAVDGTRVAPGIVDRYLADTGFDSQMSLEPVQPDRKDNLFSPAPGDFAAHGPFHSNGKHSQKTAWVLSWAHGH